ncbi:MAG: hypothetical protein IJH41_07240 [Eubacterium sp.]|nr:hypothetical protein [Eubacterium sp.]
MRKIYLSDITMSMPAKTGGYDLSFREKIEVAKLLDRAGLQVVETAAIRDKRTDSLLIKSIASAVKESTVAVPLILTEKDTVKITWKALKDAKKPRLQVVAPVSTVQMEYISRMKPAAIVKKIAKLTEEAKAVCGDVEFVAWDAGRSEADFLKETIDAAVAAGATEVTLCDTAGNLLPEEFFDSVKKARKDLPKAVKLGVMISNELSLADACAVSAVLAGADEVKVSACGSFTSSLEGLVHILKVRGVEKGVSCDVRDTELNRIVTQIRRICEEKGTGTSTYDSAVHDEHGVVLTIHDDMTAVTKAAAEIGYDLSEDDAVEVYEAFSRIAAKKESVSAKELDAIIASAAMQVPSTYRIKDFVINSGNTITATCHIRMEKNGQTLDGLAVGDGPVDASFLAIEQIIGHHYELDEFEMQAVTEGREAMGETVVRLRAADGKLYSGRGISTDIIGASINAYVSAINKIVYEEGE